MNKKLFPKFISQCQGLSITEGVMSVALLGIAAVAGSTFLRNQVTANAHLEYMDGLRSLRNYVLYDMGLDCEKTVAQTCSSSGGYYAGVSHDGVDVINKFTDSAHETVVQNFGLRIKCGGSIPDGQFIVEARRRLPDGTTAKDPVSKKPLDYQDIFNSMPVFNCAYTAPTCSVSKFQGATCPATTDGRSADMVQLTDPASVMLSFNPSGSVKEARFNGRSVVTNDPTVDLITIPAQNPAPGPTRISASVTGYRGETIDCSCDVSVNLIQVCPFSSDNYTFDFVTPISTKQGFLHYPINMAGIRVPPPIPTAPIPTPHTNPTVIVGSMKSITIGKATTINGPIVSQVDGYIMTNQYYWDTAGGQIFDSSTSQLLPPIQIHYCYELKSSPSPNPAAVDPVCITAQTKDAPLVWIAGWYDKNEPTHTCPFHNVLVRDSGCFAPGTSILLGDQRWTDVQNVRSGMWVWNPVRQQAYEVEKVVAGPEKIPLLAMTYDDGNFKVTTKHPMVTKLGIKKAEDLTLQDEVLGIDGSFHQLKNIDEVRLADSENVWNFSVKADSDDIDAHMIVANGIVTGDLTTQTALEKQTTETSRTESAR